MIVKAFMMLPKISISNNHCSFELLYSSMNDKYMYHALQKNVSSTIIFLFATL